MSGGGSFVLYVDHQGHPAPITECFHATASRRLSSTVYRYPAASLQEVDSGYCPQCLTFHDATTAADLGYCSNKTATCQKCPLCLSVASVHTDDVITTSDDTTTGKTECFYKCGMCDWTSKECNLTAAVPVPAAAGEQLSRLELAKAAEDMGTALAERRRQATQPVENLYQHVSESWKNRKKAQKQQEKSTRMPKYSAATEAWSVETLEAKLNEKAAALLQPLDDKDAPLLPTNIPGLELKRVTPEDAEEKPESLLSSRHFPDDLSLLSYQLQCCHSAPITNPAQEEETTKSRLLPLPMPLALRKSRRCRAELADGRPGILLKPKLNPLEGDSSLPTGHGQWHRKDSSAIHVIPRVNIVRQYQSSENNNVFFLLKISNPTLSAVRLRLTTSTYQGETNVWSEEYDDDDATLGAKTRKTTLFSWLLVDTLTQTYVDVELKPNWTETLVTSETVELLSAEDSIIELGGRARRTPEEVNNWNPALEKGDEAQRSTRLRLVAKSASDAWFELVVAGVADENASSGTTAKKKATAIPLALQVDLGNGSWESSLVPVAEGKENDSVTFDLVLAWL